MERDGDAVKGCRFDERVGFLHIRYVPTDPLAEDDGPISVGIPGASTMMTPDEAEEAAKLLMGCAAVARLHSRHTGLVCPPDCPRCGIQAEPLGEWWACFGCRLYLGRRTI